MAYKKLLIVFARNPVKGKVKTRLSKTIGDELALTVYTKLLSHTLAISLNLHCDKVIYYSDQIPTDDDWKQSGFSQELQQGADLGQRMAYAFKKSFRAGYHHVCIIGTDCHELSTAILTQAFDVLKDHDAVIGPARDGGYYLLGLTAFCERIFLDKQWGTASILRETINSVKENKLSFSLLPELRDIDTEEDLKASTLSNLVL